jgi:hypothetical protein
MWLTILFVGIAAIFALMTVGALSHLRWVRRLPPQPLASTGDSTLPSGDPPLGTEKRLKFTSATKQSTHFSLSSGQGPENTGGSPMLPRISIVLAARDEAARIENTIRHLLAQRDVSVEIIVVDDRSTDATGEILRQFAKEDARVKPRRVEELPDGWLGKCHACHVGASVATGDWILFTDADCWMKPDLIARALAAAEREHVEHVTLTPGIAPETAGAGAWHLLFLMSMADWISGVNRDQPKRYLGMGAFNFVRTPAYRASDGYEALRLTVLDDVKFGLLLRRAGHRTRAFLGGDDVECHWGTTVGQMIKIMEKNYFAALEFRISAALLLGLGAPLVWLGAIVGPFTGTPAGAAAGLALCSLMLPTAILARRLNWPWRFAALAPLVFPALFYAALKSAVVTLHQGGVRWRGSARRNTALNGIAGPERHRPVIRKPHPDFPFQPGPLLQDADKPGIDLSRGRGNLRGYALQPCGLHVDRTARCHRDHRDPGRTPLARAG